MKIEYDKETDTLYIQFHGVLDEDNLDVDDGVIVDRDKEGHIVGLEFLGARARFGMKAIANITNENLPVEESTD